MNNYVSNLRDAFEDFEENGKIKIGFENESVYKGDTQRKKQRSVKLSGNDSNSEDTIFSGRKNFRITVSSHDHSLVNSTSEEAESI